MGVTMRCNPIKIQFVNTNATFNRPLTLVTLVLCRVATHYYLGVELDLDSFLEAELCHS